MGEKKDFNLAVLLSGSGSTLVNLQKFIDDGVVNAKISIVISSRKNVLGITHAKNFGIPVEFIGRKNFTTNGQFDKDGYSAKLASVLEPYSPDLIVMAGFMTQVTAKLLDHFPTVNVHPALLPSFGGKGFYGHHVHEAVINEGVKLSGATVHFANSEYDRGPIIMQDIVKIENDDTPDTLADKVQALERKIYPLAIALIADGKVKTEGNKTIISQ